jgi:hypothetical protein
MYFAREVSYEESGILVVGILCFVHHRVCTAIIRSAGGGGRQNFVPVFFCEQRQTGMRTGCL